MDIKITLKNENYVQVELPYDKKLLKIIKAVPGRRWNPAKKIWTYPNLNCNTQYFLEGLYKSGLFNSKETKQSRMTPLQKMIKYLKLKEYSQHTIKAYEQQVINFFRRTNLETEEVTSQDIVLYIEKIKSIAGYSKPYIVQFISALKCYYKHGTGTAFNPAAKIPLPKKEHKYPDILSRHEVELIIKRGTYNIKHEFLLMLIYSSGLRVNEAVKLKKEDVDIERKMLHIRGGKGNKDRFVMLSDTAASVFERYRNRVFIRNWLFPGASEDSHLSVRSAQAVFYQACERTGIEKNVSIHSLRHAFATHLLEDGVDIRYIQELLGHKNIKTTEIYTHVTKTSLMNIKSPLDRWENTRY